MTGPDKMFKICSGRRKALWENFMSKFVSDRYVGFHEAGKSASCKSGAIQSLLVQDSLINIFRRTLSVVLRATSLETSVMPLHACSNRPTAARTPWFNARCNMPQDQSPSRNRRDALTLRKITCMRPTLGFECFDPVSPIQKVNIRTLPRGEWVSDNLWKRVGYFSWS